MQGHVAGWVQDEVPAPIRLPPGSVLAAANQWPRHETFHQLQISNNTLYSACKIGRTNTSQTRYKQIWLHS